MPQATERFALGNLFSNVTFAFDARGFGVIVPPIFVHDSALDRDPGHIQMFAGLAGSEI